MLGRVHQHEGHRQRVRHQQRTPPAPDPPPQEDRNHCGQRGVQRGNRRDQIHAGLSRVDQRAGRLQMQRPPAASGNPLHELVSARLARMHRAQQSAVGNARSASVHARRVGRAAGDVGRCAARGRPRRGRGQDYVDGDRRERQRNEPTDECRPVGPVVQPEHPRDRIRQDEERHVDAADDHFPPGRLRHLDALLQPHRRDGAEEQPAISIGLESPERGRAEHVSRTATEVVEHQHECERQPIAHDGEHLVPAADARGDEAGSDVQQQQFAVERDPVRHGSVGDHQGPRADGDTPCPGEPKLAAGRIRLVGGMGLLRRHGGRPAGAASPSRFGLWVALEQSDPAIGYYCHQSDLILCRPFSTRSFSRRFAIRPINQPNTL